MHKFGETRRGLTRRIVIDKFDIYITVNNLEKGKPGEVFIKIAKTGSIVAALLEALATTISISLQSGVPWQVLKEKYLGHKFEPYDLDGKSMLHKIAETVEELSNA
jgi:ribonucleoside-diphosphate reductase alpha chain